MPPLVYSRVAIRIGFCRLQPTALGKERIMAIPMPIQQDTRRLDRQGMSRVQIARLCMSIGDGHEVRGYARSKPGMALGPRVRRHVLAALH